MYILAFHTEQNKLKAALIRKEAKKVEIELLKSFDAPDVKPLYILESILAEKNVTLITGLEASEVLIREVTLKLSRARALEQALPFQLESLLPYSLDEAIIVPFYRKMDKKTTAISIFTTRRSNLENHLDICKRIEIDPDQVSCVPSALCQFANFVLPNVSDLIVFHFGEEKSTYLCISSGVVIFAHTLPIGEKQIRESIGTTEALMERFHKELSRMTAFLTKKTPCTDILLTGEIPGNLSEFIKNSLAPTFNFLVLDDKISELQSFAIPIGLALENDKMQFLQGPYKPIRAIKREKKRNLTYFLSSIALCAILALGTFTLTKKRENTLFERLNNEIVLSGSETLVEAIDSWEEKMAGQKPAFSYSLTVPKVSDLLAWISSHPKLEGIEIKKVHYTLTKFPRLGKENEPYETKVDLEFSASSPRNAREFHEVLLAGDEIVNAKTPITWNANQDSYHTSFFLKRKAAS